MILHCSSDPWFLMRFCAPQSVCVCVCACDTFNDTDVHKIGSHHQQHHQQRHLHHLHHGALDGVLQGRVSQRLNAGFD